MRQTLMALIGLSLLAVLVGACATGPTLSARTEARSGAEVLEVRAEHSSSWDRRVLIESSDDTAPDAMPRTFALDAASALMTFELNAAFQDSQEDEELLDELAKEDAADDMDSTSDKTGTNPINFQNELRLYHEHTWLNTRGDGDQDLTTVELRAPLFEGKAQIRIKARRVGIVADTNDDGTDDIDDGGLGDTDVRFLTVPYMDMENLVAGAVGMEFFLPTAAEDPLGSGATVLGPQVFGVLFKRLGFDLIAPAFQQLYSIEEDSGRDRVRQGLIDVFALKLSESKKQWMLINPTLIFDYKNDTEFLNFDIEVGSMLDDLVGAIGHSLYVRPNVQFGSDRPGDYGIEIGYKFIW